MHDSEALVQKGVGWMLRYAGDVDRGALTRFLDHHAPNMPPIMRRYAIEKLDKSLRDHYSGKRA